jgi:hypothetical protein
VTAQNPYRIQPFPKVKQQNAITQMTSGAVCIDTFYLGLFNDAPRLYSE